MEKIEGTGLSLRFPHFDEVLKFNHDVPWFEVIVDDFLVKGPHWDKLTKLRSNKPIAMHSIGLNVGGVGTWDSSYLATLKKLYNQFQPQWISDHLCWSAHNGKYHHDLLPIPRTEEGLRHVVSRVNYLQDYFERPLVLENITQYIDYKNSKYTEIEFITELTKQTECYLLLDVTNVIINHKNRKLDYNKFLEHFPMDRVKQFHVAGGVFNDEFWVDTHTEEVPDEDISTLRNIYSNYGPIPGVIERDGSLPSFRTLEKECIKVNEAINGL